MKVLPATNLTISQCLEAIGYSRSSVGGDAVWRLDQSQVGKILRVKVEILERKGQFSVRKCNVMIDLNSLLDQIQVVAKKKFGKIASVSGSVRSDGSIGFIMEVPPRKLAKSERSAAESGGAGSVVGWTTRITNLESAVGLHFTEAFAFGDTIDHWWAKATASVADAIAPNTRKLWKTCNLLELSLPIVVLPVNTAAAINAFVANAPASLSNIEWPTALQKTLRDGKILFESRVATVIEDMTAPLEILEIRESASIWQEVDRQIGSRSVIEMFAPDAQIGGLEVLPRIGANRRVNTVDIKKFFLGSMPELGRASMLTLTGALVVAKGLRLDKERVYILSNLMRKIADAYGELSSIEPLANLSAEILGDHWVSADPSMAFKSWATSVQDGRCNPRVQHKIANLARETRDSQVELEALILLAEYEQRTDSLDLVASRLIDLVESEPVLILNDHAYLGALERIFGILRDNCKVILALVPRWVQRKEHLRALTAIESCLSHIPIKHSPAENAALNAAMAEIWYRQMDNWELASARYVLATSAPADPSDKIIAAAIQFFIETDTPMNLQRALALSKLKNSGTSVLEIYEKSADFQVGKQEATAAYTNVLRAIEQGSAKISYLETIEAAAENEGLDKSRLAVALLKADTSALSTGDACTWRLTAGRWAVKTPETMAQGLETFRNPNVVAMLSSKEAEQVYKFLITEKMTAELSQFCAGRLGEASNDEIGQITNLIVVHGLYMDGDVFEWTVAERAGSCLDLDASVRRAKWLIGNKKAATLGCLLRFHMTTLAGSARLLEFLSAVSEDIIASGNTIFVDCLEEIFDEPMVKLAFKDDQYSAIAQKYLMAGFTALGERCMRISIGLGQVVLESEEFVTAILLDDPASLAKWHFKAASMLPAGDRRTKSGDTALKLWMSTDERPAEIIDLLIAEERALALDVPSIQMLEMLCVREAKMEVMIAFLDQKIRGCDGAVKNDFVHWCLRLIMAHLKDYDKAADLFQQWTNGDKDQTMQRDFTLAQLRSRSENRTGVSTACHSVLDTQEILNEPEMIFVILNLLVLQKNGHKNLQAAIEPLLAGARASSNIALVQRLTDFAIANEVASPSDLDRSFIEKFAVKDPKDLAKIAIQVLISAEKLPLGLPKTIAEWELASAVVKNQGKWWEVVRLLTEEQMLSRLNTQSRCDLLYLNAKNLFDSDKNRHSSAEKFEAIELENPMDSRTWIPLYSIFEENGNTEKLIAHLQRIIPLIELDMNTIEKTPLTIETLKSSLARAYNKLPGATQSAPKNKNILVNFVKKEANPLSSHGKWKMHAGEKNTNGVGMAASLRRGTSHEEQRSRVANEHSASVHGSSAFAVNEDSALVQVQSDTNTLQQTKDHQLSLRFSVLGAEAPALEKILAREGVYRVNADKVDWRTVDESASNSRGMTRQVLAAPFASELEKHMAVQYVALITGDVAPLELWHWPVWKNRAPYEYSLAVSDREIDVVQSTQIGGQLHQLLNVLRPILVRSRQEKFLIESKLTSLGRSRQKNSVAVDVHHPAITRAGLRYFMSHFAGAKIALFDTSGLGEEVFYDYKMREIHFDGEHQCGLPPGVLTHRALEILLNVGNGNIAILVLDPTRDILPVLEAVKNIYSSSGLSRLRLAFGMQSPEIVNQLKSVNKDKLVSLLVAAGSPSIRQIFSLQFDLRMQGLTKILASTLDLIGVLESLTGKSLTGQVVLEPNGILEMTPYAPELLAVAKILKL